MGRPCTRWADELRSTVGPNWEKKSKNRSNWKSLVAAYAQRWAVEGATFDGKHPLA